MQRRPTSNASSGEAVVPCAWTGWHYSYTALALGSFTKACSSPGQSPFIGVFIDRYIEDLHLNRTLVSALYFVATMSSAGSLPFAGGAMDSHGLRTSALCASAGLVVTCIVFALGVRNAITLLIGFYLLRFFGQGLMSIVGANIINMWWIKRRGVVQGISGVFLTLAMTGALPPLATYGLRKIGWRNTYYCIGAVLAVVYLPIAYFVILDSPESVGMKPDAEANDDTNVNNNNREDEEDGAPDDDGVDGEVVLEGITRREAITHLVFWVVSSCNVCWAALSTAVFFHLTDVFGEVYAEKKTDQMDNLDGVLRYVYICQSITSGATSLTVGYLFDICPVQPLLLFASCIQIIATVLLANLQPTMTSAIVFAFAFGIQNGSMNNMSSMAMARLFGRRELNKITSLATSTAVVGSALGPLPLGAANDYFGGYSRGLLIAALWPVFNAILLLVNIAMTMEEDERKAAAAAPIKRAPRSTLPPSTSQSQLANEDDDADVEDRLLLRDDL